MWRGVITLWTCLCTVVILTHARTQTDCSLSSREVTEVDGCALLNPAIETQCSGVCASTSQTVLGHNPTAQYKDCDCCRATVSSQATVSMDCPARGPATLTATCDNNMKVYFNSILQADPNGEQNNWRVASTYNVPIGTNKVTIECTDTGVKWGILASFDNGIITDGSWNCWTATTPSAPATIVNPHGVGPWGNIAGIAGNAHWIWSASSNTDPRWALDVTCSRNVAPSGGNTRGPFNYTVIEQCGCSDCEPEAFTLPTW